MYYLGYTLSFILISGQTWVQEMIYLIINDGNIEKADAKPMFKRVAFLELRPQGSTDEKCLRFLEKLPSPRILKTHAPLRFLPSAIQENKLKIIYVLRNPKDVMVSYYHFYKANHVFGPYKGSWDEFYEMAMLGEVAWGNWFDHVLEWWKHGQHRANVLFLKYEDMLYDHRGTVEKIANFLNKKIDWEKIDRIIHYTSFDQMKNNPSTNLSTVKTINQEISPFQRKGVVGDWKNYFSKAQSEKFDILYAKKMQGSQLHFRFDQLSPKL